MSTRQLFLMRHGKAEAGTSGQRDHERALAPRGLLSAADQARCFPPAAGDAMLVSDAVRTQQTADVLYSTWRDLGIEEADLPLRRDTASGYLATAGQWMDLIVMQSGHPRLWIVGHNPGISHLVMELTGDYIGMTTADIVSIALDIPGWPDIAAGSGRVLHHRTGRGV
jgi:phosphohistidine phosphatase